MLVCIVHPCSGGARSSGGHFFTFPSLPETDLIALPSSLAIARAFLDSWKLFYWDIVKTGQSKSGQAPTAAVVEILAN